MTIRVFNRLVWQPNGTWPDGYEPLAVPMDSCRTLVEFNTRAEAVEYCDERNEKWRKHITRVNLHEATPKQIRVYYTARRYEWEEL